MSRLRWTSIDHPTHQTTLFGEVAQRHVGKGEYRGLEFFQVEAKRLINHVPAYLPFDYTINVYRGCSHGCAYCLDGDTDILMGDGTFQPLRKVQPGDSVIGSSDLGRYRRYRETSVLDAWSTVKRAFRLRLRNGVEIIASGDHRFLTDYGWQYVKSCIEHTQPNLAFGSRLLGLESLPPPAEAGNPYRLIDAAVVGGRDLIVESIEDLDVEVPMFDITTGTGDFVANGVISHNCFARPTHDYLGFGIGADFDSKIVVKTNAVELARAETAPGRWGGHRIAMGTNTDPYQRAEGKYRLTRGVVEVLTERRNPFSILTKSTLVLRDMELLVEAVTVAEVVVDFSIPTLDEDVWRLTEPGTPHPHQRVEAVRRLNEAGVPSGVLIAPVLPGLSDQPEQLAAVADAVVAAGARFASPTYLRLRGDAIKDHWFSWLEAHRPDLVPRYRRDYGTRANATAAAEWRLTDTVRGQIAAAGGLPNPWRMPPGPATDAKPAPLDQLSLGI